MHDAIKTYSESIQNKINDLKKEIDEQERQKELLQGLGETSAIIGDFDINDFLRVVTIGDPVFTKYGDQGVITKIDGTKFKNTSYISDIYIEYKNNNGEIEKMDASRFN